MNLTCDADAFLFPGRSKFCRQSPQLFGYCSESLLSALKLRHILHRSERTTRPHRIIPDNLAPAVDEPNLTIRSNHAIFHVIRLATQRSGCRLDLHRPILRVDEFFEILNRFLRLKSEDSVGFI